MIRRTVHGSHCDSSSCTPPLTTNRDNARRVDDKAHLCSLLALWFIIMYPGPLVTVTTPQNWMDDKGPPSCAQPKIVQRLVTGPDDEAHRCSLLPIRCWAFARLVRWQRARVTLTDAEPSQGSSGCCRAGLLRVVRWQLARVSPWLMLSLRKAPPLSRAAGQAHLGGRAQPQPPSISFRFLRGYPLQLQHQNNNNNNNTNNQNNHEQQQQKHLFCCCSLPFDCCCCVGRCSFLVLFLAFAGRFLPTCGATSQAVGGLKRMGGRLKNRWVWEKGWRVEKKKVANVNS